MSKENRSIRNKESKEPINPWSGLQMVFHFKGRPKGKKSKTFDTLMTEFPVCPHCGFEDEEFEGSSKTGTAKCLKCRKKFKYYEEVEISYTTSKIQKKKAKCRR